MPRRKNAIPKPTLVRDKGGIWQISWIDPHKGYARKKSTGRKTTPLPRRLSRRMQETSCLPVPRIATPTP